MAQQRFLRLQMDMAERAAGKPALPGLDHVDILAMNIARSGHDRFAPKAFAGIGILAHPIEPDHPARFARR